MPTHLQKLISTPQRVEMSFCRCVGMNSGLGSCRLLLRAQPLDAAPRKPCRQVMVTRQPPEKTADIWIGLRIGLNDGVVHIPGFLPPRVKSNFLVRVVRVKRGDDALKAVIENDKADTKLSR